MMGLFQGAARLVILATAAALSVGITACDGGEDVRPETPGAGGGVTATATGEAASTPEPTRTLTPTTETSPTSISEPPTRLPESGGMDGFRAFATRVESALADGDASFFSDRGLEDEITCVGDDPLRPCLGHLAGAVLRGIPSATLLSDPAVLFTPDEYATALQEWFSRAKTGLSDQYGSGGLALYALARQPVGDGTAETYQAVVTGIVAVAGADLRQARVLSHQFMDGSWRLTGELVVTTPNDIANWLSGECDFCYDHWEGWGDTP